jgi:hypothetical protein
MISDRSLTFSDALHFVLPITPSSVVIELTLRLSRCLTDLHPASKLPLLGRPLCTAGASVPCELISFCAVHDDPKCGNEPCRRL